MPLIPLKTVPGIVRSESPYDSPGRWIDGDKVRFVKGQPEKIGGWEKLISTPVSGVPRGLWSWIDNVGSTHVTLGTPCKLYVILGSDLLQDITPLRVTGTLTDPFTTVNGSDIVTVADLNHGFKTTSETAIFSGASLVGGLDLNGTWKVHEIVDPDTYRIKTLTPATSSATGGGTVTYSYEINCGLANNLLARGWGVGGYGRETYGTPRMESAVSLLARFWSLQNYGQNLLALHNDGTLYEWSPLLGGRAAAVANAPTAKRMFITEERFPFLLGADGDDMLVRWPDQNDITVWTPAENNTANQRRLQIGSQLLCGLPLSQGIALVWSDKACFLFQYTGSSFIYDSRSVSDASGIIGPFAAAVSGGAAFWMGGSTFWMYNGAVQEVPNVEDIKDWVFSQLDRDQASKVVCGYNVGHSEIWWLFPGSGDLEPTNYVAVNLKNFAWTSGTLSRTSMARYLLGREQPIMTSVDGYVFRHEEGLDADGAAMNSFITLAPSNIEGGDRVLDVWRIVPDFARHVGTVMIEVQGLEWPRDSSPDTETVSVSPTDDLEDVHVSGRQIGLKVSSSEVGGDFRLGKIRIDVSDAGEIR